MNCPKCQTQNEPDAKFCRNCGMDFQFNYGKVEHVSTTADTTILIILILIFVITLSEFVIQKLVVSWYNSPFKYIQIGLNLIWAFIPVILGTVIKNKTMKIIGIIAGALYCIYIIYRNIEWLLE